MNQHLIDQLLHKAGAHFGGDGIDYSGFEPSKFADMIVKECIAQCESQNTVITTDIGTEAWGEISDAVEQIKRHFYGVEE